MGEGSIKGIMEVTMDKIRSMVDAETIIGDPIQMGEISIIPVSKISFGLASGGSDFSVKNNAQPMFGGGGGAGVSITPVAFLVVKDGDVKMLRIYKDENTADKAIGMLPDLFDKISSMFKKSDKKETVITVSEE